MTRRKALHTVFLLLITTLSQVQASDRELNQAKHEAKTLGKEQRKALIELLSQNHSIEDDLLPEAEKGQRMDPMQAKELAKNRGGEVQSHELYQQILQSKLREKMEGTEDYMTLSKTTIDNPQASIEILEEKRSVQPEEIQLETCQESGMYQTSIEQHLQVAVIPAIKTRITKCLGHTKKKSFYWKEDAQKAKESKKKEFKKDRSIKVYHFELTGGGILHDYTLCSSWSHHDNSDQCDHQKTEEIVEREGKIDESWKTDQSKQLEALQNDPNCQLLYPQIIEGPMTKVISGEPIFKEVWSRRLFFSCGGSEGKKCQSLRSLGGVLTKKKCLNENEFGECQQWEKTYDIGKRASRSTTTIAFQKEGLWGLEETSPNYEKNRDLPEVAATLSIFADIKSEIEKTSEEYKMKSPQVFKGEVYKCQRSFIKGILYDCCKKMDGLAVHAKLASCNSEEKCLSVKRHEGKCRFIGITKGKLGTETTHVFCCFPTKLARIIQEQGRQQLGIPWGNADNPVPRGFTLEELQRIDFTKIDFSEVLDDLKIDPQDLKNKIQNHLQDFELNTEFSRTERATAKIINEEENGLKNQNEK